MQCLISLQMAGTPCWCCTDGWDLHSKLWKIPSRFCPSLLTPGWLPTLPNAELGQDWLVLHRCQQCLTKIQRPWAQTELQEVTVKHRKKHTLPWVQTNPGTRCAKGLLSLHTWRYLNPAGSVQSLAVFWEGQLDQTTPRGHFWQPSCTDSMNQSKTRFVALAI